MFRRIDTIAIILAIAFHAGIGFAMIHMPVPKPHVPTSIEVEMKKAPPTPPTVMPEPPPPPERKVVEKIKQQPPPSTPPPNAKPAEPPKEPPKPVFGLPDTELTNDDSNVAMPAGNTLGIDPKDSGKGKAAPLPAAPPGPPPKPEYKPVADIYLKSQPEIDTEACARMVQYPPEAEQLGIEGEVKFRVALDETGKVHDIKVLHGLGHGLDQAAMHALQYKCKFKPAMGTDGKPVAYVIQTYTWEFVLPR